MKEREPYSLCVKVAGEKHYFWGLTRSALFSTLKKFAQESDDTMDFECIGACPRVTFIWPENKKDV